MGSQLVLFFFSKKPNHRELGGLFFKDMGASSFKIQLITQQLREYAWHLLMPGAGNVSRFSIFSDPASPNTPCFGGGSPASSLLQGHQARAVFSHSLGVCIYVWTFDSAILIFLDGDSNNRGNAHLFIEAWQAGGGPLSISLFIVDPKAVATQRSMLTSEGEKWLRALLFLTEEWLKAPPAAIPTQPAMGWASRGSF